jgi:hypothetical protein
MAIKIPKGVSNSVGMGSTPGTVTTAAQNVGGANINPNMPRQPQLNRQARSGMQRGMGQMPTPSPLQRPQQPPSMPGRSPAVRQSPVVSQGIPMDSSRGYNIFSGQNAQEISDANQKMGLSNMTALPSVSQGFSISPVTQQFSQGRPDSMQFFSTTDAPSPFTEDFAEQQKNENTAKLREYLFDFSDIEDPETLYGQIGQSSNFIPTKDPDEELSNAKDTIENEAIGIDPDKKQEMFDTLDQEYAYQMQFALDNLDRQAAMMGTFGSGSHMRNVNNAIAQSLSDMAQKYNEINLLDAQLAETDYQQNVDNYIKLAAGYTGSLQDKINVGMKIDEIIITPYAEWIDSQENISDEEKLRLQQWLNTTTSTMFQNLISEGYTVEQAIALATQQVKESFNDLGYDIA